MEVALLTRSLHPHNGTQKLKLQQVKTYASASYGHARSDPIASSSDSLRARRQLRYSRDEAALNASLGKCALERSPHELQIRALEEATALMVTRAQETRERALKLRQRLADPDLNIDNRSYAELKNERWMEERRLSMVNFDEKKLSESLMALKKLKDNDVLPRVPQEPEKNTRWNEAVARKQENLARFLESSSTKRPLRRHHSRRLGSVPYRRVTLSDVSALQLQPSSIPTQSRFLHHGRSKSLSRAIADTTELPKVQAGMRKTAPPPLSFNRPSPILVEVDRGMALSPGALTATSMQDYSESSKRPPTILEEPVSHVSEELPWEHGAVSMIPTVAFRPDEEVLRELGDVAVPEYVQDLMDGFEHNVQTPSLRLNDPRRLSWASTMVGRPTFEETHYAPSLDIPKPSRPKARVRSIFSLELSSPSKRISTLVTPSHASFASSSHTTLGARDTSPTPRSRNRLMKRPSFSAPHFHLNPKRAALRSTRNWDLAQLDGAPDDIQECVEKIPIHSPSEDHPQTTRPRSTRVVDRVRQRLSVLSLK